MKSKHGKLSVFISLILRHKPETIGMKLNGNGYLSVDELIENVSATGRKINKEILNEIVDTDEKGRYSYNSDKTMIRANQGHSVKVDVNLEEKRPPEFLYHGTYKNVKDLILKEGLKKQNRLYVHLSENIETAYKVGSRRGDSVVLLINSEKMFKDGYKFFISKNNVWLTDNVNEKYIKEMNN